MQDCCKDTKYNLLLKIDSNNLNEQTKIVSGLKKVLGWNQVKSEAAVNHAVMTGQFLIETGTADKLTKLSLKLGLESIPHQMLLSKKQ